MIRATVPIFVLIFSVAMGLQVRDREPLIISSTSSFIRGDCTSVRFCCPRQAICRPAVSESPSPERGKEHVKLTLKLCLC